MKIVYKNAEKEDINKIVELNRDLIKKYETDLSLDFSKIYNWIEKKVKSNIENYKCIYIKETKAGYFFLHDKGEKLELDDFFVFKEFQRKGIGTNVLKHIASIADNENKKIFLYVFKSNHGAINLYIKNGYKVIENISNSRYIMST